MATQNSFLIKWKKTGIYEQVIIYDNDWPYDGCCTVKNVERGSTPQSCRQDDFEIVQYLQPPEDKWPVRFMQMARMVATWSKDPATKVGAVLVSENNRILSVGYNGFPTNVIDSETRLHNKEFKNKMMVHAERNCIYNYRGVIPPYSTIYTTLFPCLDCIKTIGEFGIGSIVYDTDMSEDQKCRYHYDTVLEIGKEQGILIRKYRGTW